MNKLCAPSHGPSWLPFFPSPRKNHKKAFAAPQTFFWFMSNFMYLDEKISAGQLDLLMTTKTLELLTNLPALLCERNLIYIKSHKEKIIILVTALDCKLLKYHMYFYPVRSFKSLHSVSKKPLDSHAAHRNILLSLQKPVWLQYQMNLKSLALFPSSSPLAPVKNG